jgi:hypothetical protein
MRILLLIFTILLCNITIACDCSDLESFSSNYLNHYNNEDVFFAKGIKLKTENHGMWVRVIEDIKGNISEDTVMIWGAGGISCRLDRVIDYSDNDTLLVLLQRTDLTENTLKPDREPFENENDYMVINCYYSIVKYSNGYITGKIISGETSSILWEDFLSQLSTEAINPEFNNITYYPNPVADKLYIESPSTMVLPLYAKIYNNAGQLVMQQNYTLSAFTIDVRFLNSGVYIISITDRYKKKLTNKFIKQ